MGRGSNRGERFGVFAVSGSTIASMALSALFYLVLPLSLPLTLAQKSAHCHCPMCRESADGAHQCCKTGSGICNCDTSTTGDDAVIVLIREIPSLPIYGKFQVPYLFRYRLAESLTPYAGVVLPVETPPPEA